MRFFVQHKKSEFISLLVVLFSLTFYLFIFFSVLLKFGSNQFFPEEIVLDINGNLDEFIEPKELTALIENIHINLFINLIGFLSIAGILFRTLINHKLKILLVFVGFLSILIYPLSLLGIKFLWEGFGYLAFASFLLIIIVFFVVNSINILSFLNGKIR